MFSLDMIYAWLSAQTANFKDKTLGAKLKAALPALALVFVSVLMFLLGKSKTTRAKILDVLGNDKKADAKLDQVLNTIKENADEHKARLKHVLEAADKIEKELDEVSTLAKKDLQTINKIKSWEDVDKKVK